MRRSRGLGHASGFDTGGANDYFLGPAVPQSAHALQIGIETTFGHVVGVAHMAAYNGMLSTNFTNLGHLQYSPFLELDRLESADILA
jgi:hypothetical protein